MSQKKPNYQSIENPNPASVPIKAWTRGVPLEAEAQAQLQRTATLPFIYKWLAVMPDVHFGKGSTVGSVIPTVGAIIPAAVGVDIGCGMMAVRTSLTASQLPDSLKEMRSAIEKAIPHGRTVGRRHKRDKGSWGKIPEPVQHAWKPLEKTYRALAEKHPRLGEGNDVNHLGTLGTGNHFVEVCLDEEDRVWFMLHSGSRGVGNRIGSFFIELAKDDMRTHLKNLPDEDLAYLKEGTRHFDDYVEAVTWAQDFAKTNRRLMMDALIRAVRSLESIPPFTLEQAAINCHHNYVQKEKHYGEVVYVTRKGAVRAGTNELGIIPGSMGTGSFIVRGKGNPESFESCSHGAGRKMSRNAAKKLFSLEDHLKAMKGIESRRDVDVIDETPGAYKDIDAVMAAQSDLVEIVHRLRQVVVVKG